MSRQLHSNHPRTRKHTSAGCTVFHFSFLTGQTQRRSNPYIIPFCYQKPNSGRINSRYHTFKSITTSEILLNSALSCTQHVLNQYVCVHKLVTHFNIFYLFFLLFKLFYQTSRCTSLCAHRACLERQKNDLYNYFLNTVHCMKC